MNGEDLYEQHRACILHLSGIVLTAWDYLEDYERLAWQMLAEMVHTI